MSYLHVGKCPLYAGGWTYIKVEEGVLFIQVVGHTLRLSDVGLILSPFLRYRLSVWGKR